MKIEHLEEFLDLSKTLNFTQTAKNFYITQPVLSKHIAALEQELGGKLFERGMRGIFLTAFGKALLPAAARLINDKKRLLKDAMNLTHGKSITIKVGYLEGAARPHIPHIQKRLKAVHPDVNVNYLVYEFDKIFKALETSAVDMVIGGVGGEIDQSSYKVCPVYKDDYRMLVRKTDALSVLDQITPQDLAGRRVVMPDRAFLGPDAQELMAWLDPKENDIELLESVHDINSILLSAETEDAVSPTLGHLSVFYGQEFQLVPMAGFSCKLTLAVIWLKAAEKPFFEDFASITREVIEEYGY